MPNLSDHSSGDFVRILFIGASGAGKTGALTSLVAAGYKLRIIDMDNGLDALVNHIKTECPDKIDNVKYQTFRDKYKSGPAGINVAGAPKAYTGAVKALDKWDDDTTPSEWGADTILVIDSLTQLGFDAYAWARGMMPATKEIRQWYQEAQNSIEYVMALVTSEDFKTNVIVISHIDVREQADGTMKGFASSIGKALGPKLPRFFNTLLLSETVGHGKNVKRKIKTYPTALIDLKNPAPMRIEAEYPIETGLATLFAELKK